MSIRLARTIVGFAFIALVSLKGTGMAVGGPEEKKNSGKEDAKLLQGVWYLEAMELGGMRTEYKTIKAMVLTIDKAQWALAFGPDVVKDEQFVQSFGRGGTNQVNKATIFIDAAKDPKKFELRGPRGKAIWSGLYKVDNDTLTICRPLKLGGKSPTEIKSTEDDIIWIWRKSTDK